MPSAGWRCVLPLVLVFLLLGSTACGDEPERTPPGLRDPVVDSSNTRAHRLMSLVERADTLSTITRALRQTGLAKELRLGGPYTLFAPTDQAFQRYMPGFDSLLAPAGPSGRATPPPGGSAPVLPPGYRDSLRTMLHFHLVRGRFTRRDVGDSLRLGTLVNESLLLERAPGQAHRLRLLVRGTPGPIPILRTLEAQNGILHLLPRPLRIPPPDTSDPGALRRRDTTAAPASPPS